MQKILLTCFLVPIAIGTCLFQKARIKLKAKKEHLGFPSPSTAPRCDVLIKYLAVGVFHEAQRSVFRTAYLSKAVFHRPLGGLFRAAYFALACLAPAYFAPGVFHAAKRSVSRGAYLSVAIFHRPQGGIFRAAYLYKKATWIGIYFLIPILLCSSISPTLSKSAQSPPESPLHRSAVPVSPHSGDTHRGEETLSDTFTQEDSKADLSSPVLYTSSLSTLDGGPMLRTSVYGLPATLKLNFGLVDSDQDNEEGKEASIFHSSSVPVFTVPIHTRRKSHSQSTEAQSLVSSVLCLKSSNRLVDPDQDMGAGEGISDSQPAPFPVLSNQIKQELARQAPESQSLVSNVLLLESSNGFSETDTIPKTIESVLFLELPSAYAADTLWLTYWDHYLGDSPELTPGTTIPLVAFQGDFFQGNMGFSVYKWTSTPSLNSSRVFKIRNGKSMLVNTWTIFPGDQARIRFDLLTGNAQFIGPSAEFFRAQYLLSGLAAGRKIEIHPLMVTRNPDRMLSDSSTQARFMLARSLSPALFPPMEFLTPGENASGLLDSLLTQDLKSSSVIRTLPELTAQLNTLQKEIILQQAWGELLTDHISRLSLLKNLLKQPENLRKYEEWKAGIPEPCPFETIEPAYLKAFYDLALLEAQIYDQALFTILDGIPTNLRDLILGRFLMSTWRTKKGDQFAGLQKGLTLIETPWIAAKIQLLQESILPGSEFLPTPLTDTSGNTYDLNQLKGKSLLISFWISGCKFCINYYQTTLKPIFEKFGGRKDLAFISVNADKNESYWKDHLASGNYAHPEMINLHLDGGTGLLKEYSISSFPQKLLVDSDFRLFLLTKNQYSPDELSDLILRLTEENRTDSVSKPK